MALERKKPSRQSDDEMVCVRSDSTASMAVRRFIEVRDYHVMYLTSAKRLQMTHDERSGRTLQQCRRVFGAIPGDRAWNTLRC